MKFLFTLIAFFYSLNSLASNQVPVQVTGLPVYTIGDPLSHILVEKLLPGSINIRKPGALGIILWEAAIQDSNSLSIQTTLTTHNLHILRDVNYLKQSNLIAVLSTSEFFLFSHRDRPIKTIRDLKNLNDYVNVGVGSPDGTCYNIMNKIKKTLNLKINLVPYKLVQQGHNDFLGRHIDLFCTGSMIASSLKDNQSVQIISNLTDEYNVKGSMYLFSNTNMDTEQQLQLIKYIDSLRKDIDNINIFKNKEGKLLLLTGENARNFFNEERKHVLNSIN